MPYISTVERIGMEKGSQDDLIELLKEKFGSVDTEHQKKIRNCQDLDKLKNAIRKVLTINSLEELLNLL